MFRHHSIILLYSIFLSIIFCNEGNVNANEFMDSIQSHFEHFGTPFEPLELDKEQKQIIKRNVKTGKVEWRLAEINRNMEINEWTNEFSMLDDRKAEIEKKILAPAMTEYANCVMKMKKMEIKPKDKTTKIFMLNGAITILDMKPIARKDEAYLVNYVPEFSQNEHQILDVVPTHFCTSLFIVENWDKIGKRELVCTRIDSWTENDGPPKDIGNSKDCGHSKLHDPKLEKNILEFVQIKLAVDLSKMLKRFEKTDFMDVKEQKKDDHNLPLASRIAVDEHQIGKMDPNIRIYKGFIVEYDPRKLVANWLLERLTMENVLSKNSTKRLKKWNVDLELAIMFQPFDEDYKIAKQFNLNHGHLAGFRAHRKDDVHVQDTFLYPNSVPQDKEINNGYWSLIEEYALCLAGHKQSIAYVYTGPLYIPEKNKDNGQWQMKYKVIGTMKMMAVPTHLFKVIFLEFTNENDGKKSFWLESLVVSNGQEGEIEVVEEENVERKKEGFEIKEEFKEEEGKDITVEVEKDNHSWYILAKNETELDKFQSQKESYIPIPENIQALVKNCQDRTYKVTYGDVKSGGKFRKLLKQYRVPLNYIDKFAPNFQLLAKLPAQLRSMPNGSHFDEDKLAELLARKNTKKHEAFMEKISSRNDEKEEKRKSDDGEELTRKLGNKKWVAREKGVAKKTEKQEIKSSISVDIDESTSTSADDLTEKSYSSTADEKEEKKKNRRRKNKISIFEKEDDKVEEERIAKEEEKKQNSVAVLDSLTSVSIAGNMRNELELIERREEYAKNEHQRTLELEMVKHQRTLELETDKHQKALELENVKYHRALELENMQYQKTLELENDKYQKALELEKTKHKKALKLQYTEHQKALELENAKHEKALELENVKIDSLKLQIQNMQLQIELAKLKSKEPPKQ